MLFHHVNIPVEIVLKLGSPGVFIQLKYGELGNKNNSKFESYSSVYYRYLLPRRM